MSDDGHRGFIPELEATRGIAALLVAAMHVAQAPIALDGGTRMLLEASEAGGRVDAAFGTLYRVVAAGNSDVITPSVLYFFVLSGFVLTLSAHRQRSSGPLVRSLSFVVGRLFRLFPAIMAAILLFSVWFWLTGRSLASAKAFTVPRIVANMALLITDIDGVMWSMQSEVLAVPFLMLAWWSHRRFGWAAPAALTLAFVALLFVRGWRELVPWPHPNIFMYAFGFGAIAATMAPVFDARTRGLIAWASIGVFFFVPGIPLGSGRFRMIVEALAAAALIVSLSSGPVRILTPFLRTRVLRFYGRISYSLYLLHPLTLSVIWFMPDVLGASVERGAPPSLLSFALWIGSVAAITPLAWLSYRFVERPGHSVGTRLRRRIQGLRPQRQADDERAAHGRSTV